MKRLTIRDDRGKAHATRIGYYDIIEKLADYEDLEEQGLLLRLPLGVGDTFWELDQTWLTPHGYPRVAHSLQHVVYCMERLGKTTFLTEEAAKEAVAKMKGEKHETD